MRPVLFERPSEPEEKGWRRPIGGPIARSVSEQSSRLENKKSRALTPGIAAFYSVRWFRLIWLRPEHWS
jgi:hypothetical protein